MKNLKYILGISLIMLTSGLMSQQVPVYLMQRYLWQGKNPAYAGNPATPDLVFFTRQQWIGYEGAPESYLFSMTAPLQSSKMGIAADVQRISSGPLTQNAFFASYSFKVDFSDNSALSMGIRGGINGYNLKLTDLLIIDEEDPLFNYNLSNHFVPNFGVGFHYVFGDFYFDFAVPRLLRNDFLPDNRETQESESRESRVYIVQSGIRLKVSEDISVEPSISTWHSKDDPLLLDLGMLANLRETVSLAVAYRIGGGMGAFINYHGLEHFQIGYAYELPLAYDYKLASGTHEIYLGIDFGFLRSKTVSPRNF